MKASRVTTIAILVSLAAILVIIYLKSSPRTPENELDFRADDVVVKQDDVGNVNIRINNSPENRVWKLKDDQNDIVIEKLDNDIFKIDVKLTLKNGAQLKVHTQAKAKPGDKILIGGFLETKLYLEVPGI